MIRGSVASVLCAPVALVALTAVGACGGKAKAPPTPPPQPMVEKPAPPPPPPPVCVPPTEPAMITMATGDAGAAQFCSGDGADQQACFGVDLATKKYAALDAAPVAQPAALAAPTATVTTTPTEVKVCTGSDEASCKTLKPKVPKGAETPIAAAITADGATAVLMLGNAEAGKGVAEVWDVAKGKKAATIKYAKGDHKCGEVQVLGDVVFISASVCAGPAAKGALYSLKGKRLAAVGGKDFGTYGTRAVQVTATQWAFLEEGAGVVALQDVKTGKLDKTVDLLALWGGAGTERAGGNPGESALIRGGDGKLVVISGSPAAGSVGVIDVATGDVTVIEALRCAGTDPAPAAGGGGGGDEAGAATDELK